MSGIGSHLRKLTKQNSITSSISAFLYAAIATSGPWVITILGLFSFFLISDHWIFRSVVDEFRSIILYNFAFSLVGSAPVTVIATRYIADCIYKKDLRPALGIFFGCYFLMCVALLPLVSLFYIYVANFEPIIIYLAIQNYALILGIWLSVAFVSTLKSYLAIAASFLVGISVAIILGANLTWDYATAGMLFGFNVGLAVILASLIALTFKGYPHSCAGQFAFIPYFKKYWEIALGGFFYNLAIWVDKWVMWFSPEAERTPHNLLLYPQYDKAMLVAYVTVIPALALFMLYQETSFFESYIKYYHGIRECATFQMIKKNSKSLVSLVLEQGRNLFIFQGCICLIILLATLEIADFMGMGYIQISIFRLGVLGAVFHVMILFISILLAYFDWRKGVLLIQFTFFITNLTFTYISMKMGFAFYGYGYFLSCATTFLLAAFLVERYLIDLPYHTFVKPNPSKWVDIK